MRDVRGSHVTLDTPSLQYSGDGGILWPWSREAAIERKYARAIKREDTIDFLYNRLKKAMERLSAHDFDADPAFLRQCTALIERYIKKREHSFRGSRDEFLKDLSAKVMHFHMRNLKSCATKDRRRFMDDAIAAAHVIEKCIEPFVHSWVFGLDLPNANELMKLYTSLHDQMVLTYGETHERTLEVTNKIDALRREIRDHKANIERSRQQEEEKASSEAKENAKEKARRRQMWSVENLQRERMRLDDEFKTEHGYYRRAHTRCAKMAAARAAENVGATTPGRLHTERTNPTNAELAWKYTTSGIGFLHRLANVMSE